MNEKIAIQLKAALLLILFSMNTIIGFACAVGVDMGLNNKHHEEKQQIKNPVHVHKNGHKHEHHNKANKHKHEENNSNEKDGCCNDKVVKIQIAEKNITVKTTIGAPVFVAIVSSYFTIDLFELIKASPKKNIKRFFYPPPPNILVSIQKSQV